MNIVSAIRERSGQIRPLHSAMDTTSMNFGRFLEAYHQNMLEDKKKEFKATAKAAARI